MVTPFNCQVSQFFPCLLYLQALAQDALSQRWHLNQVYLFLSIALIFKSLLKSMDEGVRECSILTMDAVVSPSMSPGGMSSNQTASSPRLASLQRLHLPQPSSSGLDWLELSEGQTVRLEPL